MLNQASLWSNPELTGYLYKQGRKYKGWAKRFFVLKGGNLYYFRLKSDQQPCGVLPLENARVALETLEAPVVPSKPRRPFRRFLLAIQMGPELAKKVKRSSILLAPETSEEQGAWALMLWQATLPHAELLAELQSAGRLQALLEKHASGNTALGPAKMAQGVARKSMILMAQKKSPSQVPSDLQQDASKALEPPSFAVQASAADVRGSLLSDLMPPDRKSLLQPEVDPAARRSFFQDFPTGSSQQAQARPSVQRRTRDSMRPDTAMSHPLWDSPDSPLQAGRMSTMQPADSLPKASQQRPSHMGNIHPHSNDGLGPSEDVSASSDGMQWDGGLVGTHRPSGRASMVPSDPTLNGLRARYSVGDQPGPPMDDISEMPEGMRNETQPIYRPSVAAAQWDGVAGGLPRQSTFAANNNGLELGREGTPRNTMMPPQPSAAAYMLPARGSMMQDANGSPHMNAQQRGSMFVEAPPQMQSRPSMAPNQQPRMSTYSVAQRGTRDALTGAASGGAAGMGLQEPAGYSDRAQQDVGMPDQNHLLRMPSSGVRQSMLARPGGLQDPAGYDTSRRSIAPQPGFLEPHLEHTISQPRSQGVDGLLDPEPQGVDEVGGMPQLEQQRRQAFRRSSLLASAARQSGFGAILRRASRSMASNPTNGPIEMMEDAELAQQQPTSGVQLNRSMEAAHIQASREFDPAQARPATSPGKLQAAPRRQESALKPPKLANTVAQQPSHVFDMTTAQHALHTSGRNQHSSSGLDQLAPPHEFFMSTSGSAGTVSKVKQKPPPPPPPPAVLLKQQQQQQQQRNPPVLSQAVMPKVPRAMMTAPSRQHAVENRPQALSSSTAEHESAHQSSPPKNDASSRLAVNSPSQSPKPALTSDLHLSGVSPVAATTISASGLQAQLLARKQRLKVQQTVEKVGDIVGRVANESVQPAGQNAQLRNESPANASPLLTTSNERKQHAPAPTDRLQPVGVLKGAEKPAPAPPPPPTMTTRKLAHRPSLHEPLRLKHAAPRSNPHAARPPANIHEVESSSEMQVLTSARLEEMGDWELTGDAITWGSGGGPGGASPAATGLVQVGQPPPLSHSMQPIAVGGPREGMLTAAPPSHRQLQMVSSSPSSLSPYQPASDQMLLQHTSAPAGASASLPRTNAAAAPPPTPPSKARVMPTLARKPAQKPPAAPALPSKKAAPIPKAPPGPPTTLPKTRQLGNGTRAPPPPPPPPPPPLRTPFSASR